MDESRDDSTPNPVTPPGDFGYLPPLPTFSDDSPAVVVLHDKIRRELDHVDGFEEFCWFAREYPRCYRFHVNGAEFRLKSVHSLMRSLSADLATRIAAADGDTFECGLSDMRAAQVYWDFEAFLSEVSITLDLLARVVGPAFREESPPSFNRLCKWAGTHPLLDVFKRAQKRWVTRLKDYRDCFTHYTPVDTIFMVILRRYPDRWELRAKLPTNPNVRDILGFRFSRRVELLRYALRVHSDLMALDRVVARTLSRLYHQKKYQRRSTRYARIASSSLAVESEPREIHEQANTAIELAALRATAHSQRSETFDRARRMTNG